MRLTIQKILPTAGAVLDVTRFLDETQKQIATQEIEFNAFQRTMPDVMASLSDLDGTLTTFFSGLRAQDLIQCELYDDAGRRRFWGYVDNRTVTFLLRDRYAKFTAYSGLKRFWEKAKATKLWIPTSGTYGVPLTFTEFFRTQIDATDFSDGNTLFLGFDLGIFDTETLRGFDHASYKGSLQNLSRETTWFDMLTAMSIFHNAEFYIDPESRVLKMVRRTSVMNDRELDIDGRLCDDEEIEVSALDAKRVDYVQSFALFTLPAPSEAYKPNAVIGGIAPGMHYYIVFYDVNGISSMKSAVFAYTLPATPDWATGWQVWITIPAHPSGVGARHVYRSSHDDGDGWMRKILTIEANDAADKVILDMSPWQVIANNEVSPELDERVAAWFSFDELTGTWSTIYDAPKGMNTPTGTIFNIIPTLHFMNPFNRSVQADDDPANVFDFFMRKFDPTTENTRNKWISLFRTRRVVKCKVTGIDYEVGDSVVSNKGLFPNDLTADKRLVVRKAACNLMDNTSQLELVTV